MRVKSGFVKNKMADANIVVPTGEAAKSDAAQGMIIKMNDTASEIWDYVCQGVDAEEIANILTSEYDINYDKAVSEVEKVISTMWDIDAFR